MAAWIRSIAILVVLGLSACSGGGGGGSDGAAVAGDSTPDAFAFTPQTGVHPGAAVVSNTITVAGIDTAAAISVVAGDYAIDGGDFTTAAATITVGQRVQVRVFASDASLTTTRATLTIGGVNADFAVTTAADTTPDAFSFVSVEAVEFAAVVDSNAITVSGLGAPASISITDGEYSIDDAAFTALDGVVESDQRVTVRVVAADNFGVTKSATLNIGGVSAAFAVTTVRDTAAPLARVLFPLPTSATTGQLVTVRGVASDAENNEITAVRVEGIPATSSDGFATWQADVPLALGKTVLDVETEDAAGNIEPGAAQVTMTSGVALTDFAEPRAIAFDESNNQALVLDAGLKALIFVDLATSRRIVLSGNGVGAGPAFSAPTSVAIDRDHNRALVTDIGLKKILAVDLATGDRSEFSSNPNSCFLAGLKDQVPFGIAIDRDNGRALVLDCFSISWGIATVDLATGARGQLDTGGTRIDNLTSIAVDSLNARALITDFGQVAIVGGVEVNSPKLIAVSFATGQRTVLSGANGNRDVGGGNNSFENPVSVSVDAANNRAIVLDADTDDRGAVFGVDLATGARTVLSGPRDGGNFTGSNEVFASAISVAHNPLNNRGLVIESTRNLIHNIDLLTGIRGFITATSQVTFVSPLGLEHDPARNRVFTVDLTRGALFAIDLASSQSTVLSSSSTDDGATDFDIPNDVGFDANANRVLVPDSIKGVLAVDLTTGVRTLFTGAGVGSGPTLTAPISVAIDAANGRAFIGTFQRASSQIFSVALATGARTRLTGAGQGTGPGFNNIEEMALDADNNRLFVIALGGQIHTVDLSSGNRQLFSGSDVGSGVALSRPSEVALDREHDRLLVTDPDQDALIAIDLATGVRTLLSGPARGKGPVLQQPTGLSMTDNDIALLMDPTLDELVAVDLLTGDRVLVRR